VLTTLAASSVHPSSSGHAPRSPTAPSTLTAFETPKTPPSAKSLPYRRTSGFARPRTASSAAPRGIWTSFTSKQLNAALEARPPGMVVWVFVDRGGNRLSFEDEVAKLRLIVEAASEVWG
jgi:hypothetical protein